MYCCFVGKPRINDETKAIWSKSDTGTAPKADDFYIQAGDKYDKGGFKGAIADYTKAISLNPQYLNAYNNRGLARAIT
ncbi:tetratricopeptide repeat protein [Nostoc sp. LEGE 12450]|uniref:tetratricopeptide repeat protein n=1 Tax=Nostoc sp. LEGE 12450 TaxID=1828643 RepID=UPI003A0FD12E